MTFRKLLCLLLVACLALSASACRKKTPEDILSDAFKAYQRGDVIGATIKSQDLIKKHPDSKEAQSARMLLARSQMQNGDVEGARKTLTDIISKAGVKSQIGQAAYMNRLRTFQKPSEAINSILQTSSSLAVAPEFAWNVQMMLGQLYYENKQPDKAKAHLTQMMNGARNEENAFAAMDLLAALSIQEKKYDEALKVYQSQMEKYPNTKNKGVLLFSIGSMHKQAAQEAKDPAVKTTEQQKAGETFQTAIAFYQKQLQSEPLERGKASYTLQLSRVYRGMGDPKKADALLQDFLNKTKDKDIKAQILSEFVDISLMEQRYADAKRWLGVIAKTFPGTDLAKQASAAIVNIDGQLRQQARSGKTTATLQTVPAAGAQAPTTATATPAGAAQAPAAASPQAK